MLKLTKHVFLLIKMYKEVNELWSYDNTKKNPIN